MSGEQIFWCICGWFAIQITLFFWPPKKNEIPQIASNKRRWQLIIVEYMSRLEMFIAFSAMETILFALFGMEFDEWGWETTSNIWLGLLLVCIATTLFVCMTTKDFQVDDFSAVKKEDC